MHAYGHDHCAGHDPAHHALCSDAVRRWRVTRADWPGRSWTILACQDYMADYEQDAYEAGRAVHVAPEKAPTVVAS